MSTIEPIKIIREAVSIKNADLICQSEELGHYYLQHYDTVILVVRNREVTLIKPCSHSSIRAINQALSYIGINATCKDIVKDFTSKGLTIDKSY